MKGDSFRFHFAVLNIDFISTQHNGNILADPNQIFVPCWHVFVRDARGYVEHDDGTLALDIVAVAETAELLLACCIPDVECNRAAIGRECQRMHFHTQCGHILLLEFSSQVSLYECRLSNTSVANEHKLFFVVVFNYFS